MIIQGHHYSNSRHSVGGRFILPIRTNCTIKMSFVIKSCWVILSAADYTIYCNYFYINETYFGCMYCWESQTVQFFVLYIYIYSVQKTNKQLHIIGITARLNLSDFVIHDSLYSIASVSKDYALIFVSISTFLFPKCFSTPYWIIIALQYCAVSYVYVRVVIKDRGRSECETGRLAHLT